MANGRKKNYNSNPYNRNITSSKMFSVSADNPYAFQNQFVGKAGVEAAQEKEDKKQKEFKDLQEERKLREEKLKDLSRTYIDQFPPGADVSDASQELGSVITQEMTKYRNDYGQLAIGYPKAEMGSEQSGIIKAGMDEVINNANSLNNQVASWTEMKKDILQKASTSNYENQFSRDAKNQEVAEELLKVFTGDPDFKAEIRDGKIGYESKQQGKFVTVKEMQRMLPFGKAYDYVDNFMDIRNQVMNGEIKQDSLEAFTFPLRSSLDGEEGLRTALSLATDDVLLPGFSLMGQTAIDNNGTEVESGFEYDLDGNKKLDLIETKELMNAVYSGDKKAERILKDEVYRRLKNTLTIEATKYQSNLKTETEKDLQSKLDAQRKLSEQNLDIADKERERIKKEEEILTEKEVTDLLINNNPNYQIPVMKKVPEGAFYKYDKKRKPPEEIQETKDGVLKYTPTDITTQEGFNKNEARLLETVQKINTTYNVKLIEDDNDGNKLKVYIGPRDSNSSLIDPKAGPFTTMIQVKDWYLRNVKVKK